MKFHPDNSRDNMHDQEQEDPLWQLLENASKLEPSNSFARNIVRQTRLLPAKPSWRFLPLRDLITAPRLAASACAFGLLAAAYQLLPSTQTTQRVHSENIQTLQDTSSALGELIIEESLHAAADDPSIFTRDEVVAMIGL